MISKRAPLVLKLLNHFSIVGQDEIKYIDQNMSAVFAIHQMYT